MAVTSLDGFVLAALDAFLLRLLALAGSCW
jgi:hypothetical protein